MESGIEERAMSLLKHVHIFRPQSLASAVATLQYLPTYLFDKGRHYSMDRPVAFVALDSMTAFYWQQKADDDDALLLANTSSTLAATPSEYIRLAAALKSASSLFACPVILTSWHLGPPPSMSHVQGADARSIRPSLPAPLSGMPTLRLIVQRVPIQKFPVAVSNEEARNVSGDRQKAVEESKFEAVVNEWGLEERTLQKLQSLGTGFGFTITAAGFNVKE